MCPTGTSLRPSHPYDTSSTSEFRRAFNVIDVDHDGRISGEDLRSFYTSISNGANKGEEEMIRAMMYVADANKDGYVQFDEFERVVMNKGKGKEEECYDDGGVMEEAFKVMDKDGDGRLGVEDLRSYLKLAGIEVSDEEIKGMIKLGGGDESNGVSFHEFLHVLALHE